MYSYEINITLISVSYTHLDVYKRQVVDYVDATTIRILYDRTEDEEFVSFEPALKEYRIPSSVRLTRT